MGEFSCYPWPSVMQAQPPPTRGQRRWPHDVKHGLPRSGRWGVVLAPFLSWPGYLPGRKGSSLGTVKTAGKDQRSGKPDVRKGSPADVKRHPSRCPLSGVKRTLSLSIGEDYRKHGTPYRWHHLRERGRHLRVGWYGKRHVSVTNTQTFRIWPR